MQRSGMTQANHSPSRFSGEADTDLLCEAGAKICWKFLKKVLTQKRKFVLIIQAGKFFICEY
jgi:hypothetical protein